MRPYSATSTTVQQAVNGHTQSNDAVRTKVLLLGLKRSGKTSIQQVLFNSLPPKQTFYLEPTTKITKHTFDTIVPIEIWDFPGTTTAETLGCPLSNFSSLIFVIDIRDLYNQPISKLVEFIIAAYHENPSINIEVFVHKAEKLQEDDKIENFRQIQERIQDRLLDLSFEYEGVDFHLTSVYDHTLHEAFSRVLHKLFDSLPYIEELLDVFCANSQSPKAFLFDTTSRLYIATDASPVDSVTHNLCCDYLKMLNSFGQLYKSRTASTERRQTLPVEREVKLPLTPTLSLASGAASATTSLTPATTTPLPSRTPSPKPDNLLSKELFYPSAAATLHTSTPGTTLTYHLITRHLALLALVPTSVFETRRGLLEYNVVFFREGVQEICVVERETKGEVPL